MDSDASFAAISIFWRHFDVAEFCCQRGACSGVVFVGMRSRMFHIQPSSIKAAVQAHDNKRGAAPGLKLKTEWNSFECYTKYGANIIQAFYYKRG